MCLIKRMVGAGQGRTRHGRPCGARPGSRLVAHLMMSVHEPSVVRVRGGIGEAVVACTHLIH